MNVHTIPHIAASTATTAPTADPVLAIVDRWKTTHAGLPRLDRDVSSDVADRQWARFERALAKLEPIERAAARTPPTTTAGAAALLRLALKVGGDDMCPTERGMIDQAARFLEQAVRQ